MSVTINGTDTEQLEYLRLQARGDRRLAERSTSVVALWLGDERSEVAHGDARIQVGGPGRLTPMQALLGSLAACEVHVVAMHAARLGIELHELWVETTGNYNLTSFFGAEDPDGPGFHEAGCTIRIRTGPATDAQVQELTRLCRTSSPVADSLARRVPVATSIEVASTV